ncbi:hypothetical protein EO763_05800 [Pectobacterium odoriferum]|nr:hypothetical protein EO763_05800 [Pectobacterium odoriferum]
MTYASVFYLIGALHFFTSGWFFHIRQSFTIVCINFLLGYTDTDASFGSFSPSARFALGL